MRILVLIYLLVLSCFANPVVKQSPASKLASYTYDVDLSAPTRISAFQCMRQSLYNVAFIRGYVPIGQGYLDPYACANIQNASAVGIGTEDYMTPQPNSVKTGSQQFDEMYGGLKNANINQYGLSTGIYTNFYAWNQITDGVAVNNTMLCYWSTYGIGLTNESPPNYDDFRVFGGWSRPNVKQFAQVETLCGVTVNKDVYTVNSAQKIAGMAKYEKSEQIIVSSLGLGDAFASMAEIKQ